MTTRRLDSIKVGERLNAGHGERILIIESGRVRWIRYANGKAHRIAYEWLTGPNKGTRDYMVGVSHEEYEVTE